MIKIIQIGLGPLGQKIGKYISERKGIKTVAAIDKAPALIGNDFGTLCGLDASGIIIQENIQTALQTTKADVAILSTVSDMERITDQIKEIVAQGIPIVSTCEELSFPWKCAPELATVIDEAAKENNEE